MFLSNLTYSAWNIESSFTKVYTGLSTAVAIAGEGSTVSRVTVRVEITVFKNQISVCKCIIPAVNNHVLSKVTNVQLIIVYTNK